MIKNDGGETLNDFSQFTYIEETERQAVVEFHAPTIAVKENIGKFPVYIWRHGNLNTKAIVRYAI